MIYLDNNATTKLAPEVLEAMLPWMVDHYGNPSAGYRFGKEARRAIDTAREQAAALINAHSPEEIIFTSGGTESNHLALASALSWLPPDSTFVSSTIEHSVIHEWLGAQAEKERLSWEQVSVNEDGQLHLDEWSEQLSRSESRFATLMWANNETGVLLDVEKAAAIAESQGAYFHSDAVQAVGKVPVDVQSHPMQSAAISGHKLHGPKGIGALWVNRHSRLHPVLLGGGQENNRRSGTENVAGIIGLGKAAELAQAHIARREEQQGLRDRFESALLGEIEGVEVNGTTEPARRLPNTSNLYFPGVDGEGLLILLDQAGICCSPGSACSTGAVTPSRVLTQMGYSRARAKSSVRFSLSHLTTEDEVTEAITLIKEAVKKLQIVLPTGSRVVGPRR